ncbi:MAG: hypothetical protein Q7T48_09675 [Cellvibrio sp.]|nr:hypothetical protein [Cellvibrio sp.]
MIWFAGLAGYLDDAAIACWPDAQVAQTVGDASIRMVPDTIIE